MNFRANFENFKRAVVSLSKMCRSKMFVTEQNFTRILEIHYNIFDNSHLKFGKKGKVKSKIISDGPLIRKLNFFTN